MDIDATLRHYPLSEEMLTQAINEITSIDENDDTVFRLVRIHWLSNFGALPIGVTGKLHFFYPVENLLIRIPSWDSGVPSGMTRVLLSRFTSSIWESCTYSGWLLIRQTKAYNTPITQTTTYENNEPYHP